MRRPVGVKSIFAVRGTSLFSRRVATVAMLPFALSRSDSFRSVQVGRSRFSRCCYLFGALWPCSFRVEPGQAIDAVTGTRLWAFVFFLPGKILFLGGCSDCRSAAVVQWFVRFSAHPQVMQQHRQLSCRSHDRSLLPALPAAFGQPQSPASQVAVNAEWSQDVLRSLYEQRS